MVPPPPVCHESKERNDKDNEGLNGGLTDRDLTLSTQSGAQDPILPYGHDLS